MNDFEMRLEQAVQDPNGDGYFLSLSEARLVLGLIGELTIVTSKCHALEKYFKSQNKDINAIY